MSSERRRYERLLRIVDQIRTESQMGALVVVEGRNDASALRRIGLGEKILRIKSYGLRLREIIDSIESKRVIVLTDFDVEGQELASRISEELQHKGIHVNNIVRRQLASIVKPEVTKVEEIPSLIARMESMFP
jgi:2,5-diamino-6-(ribosylamino)-4(3H)-pyrimidinone 5'-phosphate reductase